MTEQAPHTVRLLLVVRAVIALWVLARLRHGRSRDFAVGHAAAATAY
jgi:hypothetical protein